MSEEYESDRPSVRGRPALFTSAEELGEQIDGYFRGGMRKKQIVVGSGSNKQVVEIAIPTITGLVNWLGFVNRQSFYDLEKNPEFSDTIKKARSFIEQEYEEILQTTGHSGAIFALKNFGWRDKYEIDLNDSEKEFEEIAKGMANARNLIPHNDSEAAGDDSAES